jgi:predicted DNA-binding transcriptional regulator YafY
VKRFEAVSRLHRLLTAKHQPPMSLRRICEEFECSESTAKRCIRDLRDRFNHPIEYDAELGGYHYGKTSDVDGFELPGLWFTESELTALLTMKQLLAELQPGLFEKEVAPLGKRIEEILAASGVAASEVAKRIRILSMQRRRVSDAVFRVVADAVLTRRRLSFLYKARSRPSEGETKRLVSPQRLAHYRDNWYLDAW